MQKKNRHFLVFEQFFRKSIIQWHLGNIAYKDFFLKNLYTKNWFFFTQTSKRGQARWVLATAAAASSTTTTHTPPYRVIYPCRPSGHRLYNLCARVFPVNPALSFVFIFLTPGPLYFLLTSQVLFSASISLYICTTSTTLQRLLLHAQGTSPLHWSWITSSIFKPTSTGIRLGQYSISVSCQGRKVHTTLKFFFFFHPQNDKKVDSIPQFFFFTK